ncbi:MAG: gliding motility-associated C-terminal domain-containing protein [Bacteroidetes bacterium]|nr:gliding motility-associated C-terminal domain-containing protein [Bacteroidota bacterium]
MTKRPLRFLQLRPSLLLGILLFCGVVPATAQLGNLDIQTTASTCGKANGIVKVTVPPGVATGPFQFYIDRGDGNGFTGPLPETSPSTHLYTDMVGSPGGRWIYFQVVDVPTRTVLTSLALLGDLTPGMVVNPQPTGCEDTSGRILISASYGGPPFTYSIDDGSRVVTGSDSLFTGLPTGTYKVSVSDQNGCNLDTTVIVPVLSDLSAVVGAVAPICEGDSVQLPLLSRADTYRWSPAAGLSDPTVAAPWARPATTTTYTVTVSAGPAGLCASQQAQVTVAVSPAPIASAGPDVAICSGKSVFLHGSGAGPGGKYTWSPTTFLVAPNGPAPAVNRPTESISYTLTVTSAAGCVSLVPDTIHIEVIPPFQVNAGPDTSVYMGEAAQLHATVPDSLGTVTWQWTPSTGLDNPGIADPTMVLNTPEAVQYVVEATTAGGCTGTDTVNVKVFGVADLFVPSAFTPNNDGHNDVLRVIGPGVGQLVVFAVYDRWGRQVFLTKSASVGWDGTMGGRAMDAGTYVWMAEAVDIHGKVIQKKGTVVLIR